MCKEYIIFFNSSIKNGHSMNREFPKECKQTKKKTQQKTCINYLLSSNKLSPNFSFLKQEVLIQFLLVQESGSSLRCRWDTYPGYSHLKSLRGCRSHWQSSSLTCLESERWLLAGGLSSWLLGPLPRDRGFLQSKKSERAQGEDYIYPKNLHSIISAISCCLQRLAYSV